MAQLYTLAAPGVTFQPGKCLIGVFNGPGSGRVVRIYNVRMLNNQTVAITGVSVLITANLLSTGSGGVAIVPLKHDSENETLPSQIVAASNLTYTTNSIIRRWPWSIDEPLAAGVNGIDEIETNPALMDCIYSELSLTTASEIQPFTLREGQGLGIINNTNTVLGLCDIFMTISVEEI